MLKIRCHKLRLNPNKEQEELFWQACGTARYAYNWALDEWTKAYAIGLSPSEGALRRQLNGVKEFLYPWMKDVPKSVVQQAIKNLGTAFGNFFKKTARYPVRKTRRKSTPAARLDDGPNTFDFDGKQVRLPKLGWVKTFEEFRYPEDKPLSATLKREGERWFLAVLTEVEIPDRVLGENQTRRAVGIDLGLTSAITLDTGEKFQAPKPLKTNLKKLARLQRKLSRAQKGGCNREKLRKKVSRLHWHIAQIRKDWQHKVTAGLAKRFDLVCMEDLNVRGMLRNHPLARSISDIGWAKLLRQLSYKTEVVQVGRFYPSTKSCSECGVVRKEGWSLNVRTWICSDCGTEHDRDINAAKNILAEGLRTASCAGSNALGDGSSGRKRKLPAKLLSTNKESTPSLI